MVYLSRSRCLGLVQAIGSLDGRVSNAMVMEGEGGVRLAIFGSRSGSCAVPNKVVRTVSQSGVLHLKHREGARCSPGRLRDAVTVASADGKFGPGGRVTL